MKTLEPSASGAGKVAEGCALIDIKINARVQSSGMNSKSLLEERVEEIADQFPGFGAEQRWTFS